MPPTPPPDSNSTQGPEAESIPEAIEFCGIRTNNLKNISLRIPQGDIVVLTGPSGCGKSSFAFDTLFAEGKRQFLDSLSIQARQSLRYMARPAVESVTGLQPVVCIDQQRSRPNPRSTVGTVSEILDHLRLLMSRVGIVCCANCQTPIEQSSSDEIEASILGLVERTKVVLLAPLPGTGTLESRLAEIRKGGFLRARVGGELSDLDSFDLSAFDGTETVDAVIDRLIVKPGMEDRLSESVSQALKTGQGKISILVLKPDSQQWQEIPYSTLYCCPACGQSYEEVEPRTFSFNSPFGACPACEGVGSLDRFLFEAVFAQENRSLADLEILNLLPEDNRSRRLTELEPLMEACKIQLQTPLDESTAQLVFEGTGDRIGLEKVLEKEFATATQAKLLKELENFRGPRQCEKCQGSRLCRAANHVFLGGKNINQIVNLSILDCLEFFDSLPSDLSAENRKIASPVIGEIRNRLQFLVEVGAGYLTLARRADTLSGGEFQRVRLATGIGNRLTDVCYVLDEPSSGLHPHDNQKLIAAIKKLNQLGNTVVIVEHDPDVMQIADHIIDLGPGAGSAGGQIVYQGPYSGLLECGESTTGKTILKRKQTIESRQRKLPPQEDWIHLSGATLHNLRGDLFSFPKNRLVAVTGVSGSGKSSLVNGTLVPAIRRMLGWNRPGGPFLALENADSIDRVIEIDQQPIGRSPRSNAATFTGMFDEIRKIFAATQLARQRGYTASRFSFNNREGSCSKCGGQGQVKIEMSFLPDMFVTCDACEGKRYTPSTLEVTFKGQTLADVLELRVEQALPVFENIERVSKYLVALEQAGLGYLKLGQPAPSLSGGEAQRLKISAQLASPSQGTTLFVLDEPTCGLHLVDVHRLVRVLKGLVKQGHSVLVVEHNPEFIRQADYLVDFGPGGGTAGGNIVACGTPAELAKEPASLTGKYLDFSQPGS